MKALKRPLGSQSRSLLKMMYERILDLEARIDELENKASEILEPHEGMREIIETIPGMDRTSSAVIAAELGSNLDSFQSGKGFASWVGICPGNNESAGKKKARELQKEIDT